MPIARIAARRTLYSDLLALGVVLVAVFILYREAFQGFFVQDDYGWLESSRFNSLREYLECFFRFNPALTYRPLSQEGFFWVGQKLFGMNPAGFHALSVLAHLSGCALVFVLLRQFFEPVPSAVGTLFYGVHGAHLRSVYWISAFPEPLALLFYVAAIVLFVRFDRLGSRGAYLASLAAMVLGMMSKESTLTVPLTAAAYSALFSRKRLLWTAPFFGISGLYAVLRLTSEAVRAAPYPLTFGRGAWDNLLAYFSWSAGLTETLLKIKLRWFVESSYGLVSLAFVAAAGLLFVMARKRKVAAWGIAWFLLALQPVLYFWQHIDAYYLAPSLAGLSLLVAAAFPPVLSRRNAVRWVPPAAAVLFTMWAAHASVKLEGRWWNQRTVVGREIVARLPELDRRIPPGKIAYVFGFTEKEFGIMQNDAAFKAYGFPASTRFILMGLDPDTPGQISHLKRHGGLVDYYCFVYSGGEFLDKTEEFRLRPRNFLLPVKLEAGQTEIRAGQDKLTLRVINLDARAIDVQYRLNGTAMPPIYFWPVKDGCIALFVDNLTTRGEYHFTAIGDADQRGTWYPIDLRVTVR